MTPAILNINLADETAKGLLASSGSESLAQNPEFVRRDGRQRGVRFLRPSGTGFKDADVDSGSLVEMAIGTPDDPPTAGTFGLSYLGDSTGLTALAFNITGAALQTALNANPAISGAGGVSVTKDDGLYIISFTTVGARSLLVFSKGTLSPPVQSLNNVVEVQAGDGSTQEVQIVILKKGYLAYSSDFALEAPGSIGQTNIQTGTASVPQITQIAISGSPAGGSWTFTAAQAQVVKVYCPIGDVAFDSGNYFILDDANGTVAFYVGTIPLGAANCNRSVVLTGFADGETAAQTATRLAAIIDADSEFSATASGGTVTVTAATTGARPAITNANNGNAAFGVSESTPGYAIGASFPPDATAATLAAAIGNWYFVTQDGDSSWTITGRKPGAQAAITLTDDIDYAQTWVGTLNLSTWAMYLQFAEEAASSIDSTFEVQITEPAESPVKALSISCTVRADVIDVSNLATASTGLYAYFNATVTGYTGGGSTNLDGLATTTRTVNTLLAFDHASFGSKVFKLRAGTDAEASPAIIRPDDYNASTNAKVWQAFQ